MRGNIYNPSWIIGLLNFPNYISTCTSIVKWVVMCIILCFPIWVITPNIKVATFTLYVSHNMGSITLHMTNFVVNANLKL